MAAWGTDQQAWADGAITNRVTAVPASVRERFQLAPFYQKYTGVRGFPVVSSAKVSDYAMLEAAFLIRQMLGHRTDILDALATNRVRFAVMGAGELTTDIPEHSDLTPKAYWDRRARGLGATSQRPAVSCGEENLLGFEGDPYRTENILIHEFVHAIHEMGLNSVDPTFDGRLDETYQGAMAAGLWKGKYASQNRMEYWAEGVQSWFDTNRENDHDHNHVNTRSELKEYDPGLARLLAEVFGDGPWRYQAPSARRELAHLQGYDRSKASKFAWPAELAALRGKSSAPSSEEKSELQELSLSPPSNSPASKSSEVSTSLAFVNRTSHEVGVYWIDGEGHRKFYGRMPPGGTRVQQTYEGHTWQVTDEKDQPLGSVVAPRRPARVSVR